jgi:hypothetical protein
VRRPEKESASLFTHPIRCAELSVIIDVMANGLLANRTLSEQRMHSPREAA